MKTIERIFLMMVAISLFAGCDKTDDLLFDSPIELKSDKTHEVTVPFNVDFYTIDTHDGNASPCKTTDGDNNWMRVHQTGEGTGTYLGNFSVDVIYCYCLGPNETGKYVNACFVFNGSNGDKLYGTINEGIVLFLTQPDENGNVAVYNDYLVITGGTGRFEGAFGGGYLDSYLPLSETSWQHSISSTITLMKEERDSPSISEQDERFPERISTGK